MVLVNFTKAELYAIDDLIREALTVNKDKHCPRTKEILQNTRKKAVDELVREINEDEDKDKNKDEAECDCQNCEKCGHSIRFHSQRHTLSIPSRLLEERCMVINCKCYTYHGTPNNPNRWLGKVSEKLGDTL